MSSASPAGAANYLDVAAGLGIMAVAVSLLMIGGEFDLSAGSLTGATAMLVILLGKPQAEFGGAGMSLFIAVPLSLVFALGIGYFNATMVERTGLAIVHRHAGQLLRSDRGQAGFRQALHRQGDRRGSRRGRRLRLLGQDLRCDLGPQRAHTREPRPHLRGAPHPRRGDAA